jgi:hypothetical protein
MPYGSQNHSNHSQRPPVSGVQPGNGNGGIQFNPVIKIVNGDDNSRNQGKPSAETSNSPNDDWGEIDGGSSKPIVFKEPAGGTPVEKSKTESSSVESKGFFGGLKDFVIKKLS